MLIQFGALSEQGLRDLHTSLDACCRALALSSWNSVDFELFERIAYAVYAVYAAYSSYRWRFLARLMPVTAVPSSNQVQVPATIFCRLPGYGVSVFI